MELHREMMMRKKKKDKIMERDTYIKTGIENELKVRVD